jgi:hypothetical protein
MPKMKKGLLRGASKLLFELIIVFTGVMLAFIASDLRTRSTQQQRYEKTLEVLQHEISDFITYSPVPIQAMEDSLNQFRTKRAAGRYPVPAYYREPRASGAPTAAWEALLASGAYEILDPTLFYEMTIYYNRVISVNTKFNRYMLRSEEWIMTRLHENRSAFYEGDRLKGEYQLQIQMLEEIISDLKQLGLDAKELKNKLEKEFPVRMIQ